MDSTLSAGVLATDVLSAATKPIPLVGNALGHAIEAFGKLLQAIEKAKHNKQDLKDFGEFVKVELDKIKRAVDEAPVACRPELDARFAGVTNLLNQATTDVGVLANQSFIKRVAVAQKAKDKLAELKDHLKQEVLSLLMMAHNQVLENQRREREQALNDKLKPILAGTAQGRDAPFGCMQGTREELLNEFTTWATNPAGPCVLWLSGLAGTGKSSIAQSFATRLAEAGIIVVSFFISRHAHHRSDLYGIIHTLAFELARVHPTARASILQAFERDPRIHELNIDIQVDQLLLQPLQAIASADSEASTVIVLDALDECDNPEGLVGDGCLAKIIPVLNESASLGKIKLFLTSRPLHSICAGMQPFKDRLGREVKLHEIPTTDDIRAYLKWNLGKIHRPGGVPALWPSVEDLDALVQRAGSFFIYAATVVRHITQDQYTPDERLADILNAQNTSVDNDSPYAEVDRLYLEVLSLFIGAGKHAKLTERVRRILAAIVLGREPMSIQMMSDLLQIDLGAVRRIVAGIGAIWAVPSSDSDPIVLYHESFPDFIVDTVRCTDQRFIVISSIGHEYLSTRCLHILNQQLVRDICHVPLPAGQELPNRASIGDIEDRLAQHVSPPLRYSSLHVLHHLAKVSVADCSEDIFDNLRMLCQEKLLFWLELTCLLGPATVSRLVVQLARLPMEIMNQDRISECGVLLRQFAQAVQYFEEPLQASHAEVYSSLLAFMPRNELFHAYADLDCFIKIIRAEDWDYPSNRALTRDPTHGYNPTISADGSVVVCRRKDFLLVWQNAASSSFHHAIPLVDGDPTIFALDPSGKYLVVSRQRRGLETSEISVWQLSGEEPMLLRTRSFDKNVLALNIRDMHVVYLSNYSIGALSLLDLADLSGFNHELPHPVSSTAFSAEGTAFVAVGDTEILISTADCQWKPISYGPHGRVLSADVCVEELCVSQHGLTVAVGFEDRSSGRKQVQIYGRQSWGHSEVLSTQIDTDYWKLSSSGRLIAVTDADGIVVYRLCSRQTPHQERYRHINGIGYSRPLAFSSDDKYLVSANARLLLVQNIETDEVVYRQVLPNYLDYAEILWQHRLLYVSGYSYLDVVNMLVASADHEINVRSDVIQSPTGMSAAVFDQISQGIGTVGQIWNLSDGTSFKFTAPQLTGSICSAELTSDGSSMFAVSRDGMAVITAVEGLPASVQYTPMRQDHLEAYGAALSGNEKTVAIIYRVNNESIIGKISVWDFPALSRRRDLSIMEAGDRSIDDGTWTTKVSLSSNGTLVVWKQAQEICVARCDQPYEHPHCRISWLPDVDHLTTHLMFHPDSLHIVATQVNVFDVYNATVKMWNLTDLDAPVMVLSVQLRSTLPLTDGGHFPSFPWYRKRQVSISRANLVVSPYLILALDGDDEDRPETTQGSSQVVTMRPPWALAAQTEWLSVHIGTSQTLQAPPQKVEGDAWVVDVPAPHPRHLCWLPEIYRPFGDKDYVVSGAHFQVLSSSGAVTIFDCSAHPIFQLPRAHDQDTTHTS